MKPNAQIKTLPFNCAAQIAQDIRADLFPSTLPERMSKTLEATIDAVLAVERAKVDRLVKALESAERALLGERLASSKLDDLTPYGYNGNQSFPLNKACVARTDPVLYEMREALFNALA